MSVSSLPPSQDSSPGDVPPLLARARYNNMAEAADELSFRQGDVVTVLKKDFNGQVDWWLCEMRGRVGMVPANYFEIFHDSEATYDTPRPSSRTTPLGRRRRSPSADPLDTDDDVVYDIPPHERRPSAAAEEGADYDFPPPEPGSFSPVEAPDCDCPPSHPSSARSSRSASGILLHRLSQASGSSGGTSNSQIYDLPPAELAEVYDLPKADQPAKGFEEEERGQMLMAVDIGQIMDEEAEDMLTSYCKLVKVTYENLFQTVYGKDAYWGTDNMTRRNDTLQMTIHAGKQFDRALTALLEFGKGVANSLESSHDTNFKKKYGSHYRGLLQRRHEILPKLEALPLNNETTTATVKSLLEITRVLPNAVNEFAVLVSVNKAVLFRSKSKPGSDGLPVLTNSEVKARPLPELPPTPTFQRDSCSSGYDYAYIPSEDGDPPPRPPKPMTDFRSDAGSPSLVPRHTPPLPASPSRTPNTLNSSNNSDSGLDYQLRKRNPQDHLPPLPYATVPRSPKKAPPVETSTPSTPIRGQSPTNMHLTPVRGRSPNHSRTDMNIVNGRHSPTSMSVAGDFMGHRQRSNCMVSTSRVASPLHSNPLHRPTHKRNQSYDSNLSETSSCDLNESIGGFRRVRSNDLLDGPYGRATTPSQQPHRSTSPQQLRREERELLDRFSKQMELITPSLRESVDGLLDSISVSETPKEFVTKSKLAVVAAYKLVYVADALCQKILHNETKTAILSSSNLLTESIKTLVSDTKSAALQYPSVLALEKMGESLKRIFPSALDLVKSVKSKATLI